MQPNNLDLSWVDPPGIGYIPPRDPRLIYDDAYLERYTTYDSTPMGVALVDYRRSLVLHRADHGLVVDWGCGTGSFVAHLRVAGIAAYGTEVNPRARDRLVERGFEYGSSAGPIDSICFWDVLEHLPDPGEIIRLSRRYLFISIPIFRDRRHLLSSRHLRPGEHVWYFTNTGLRQFLDVCGFEVIYENNLETRLGREDISTYVARRYRRETVSADNR